MEDQKNCVFIPLSKYVTSKKQLTYEDLRKAASWNIRDFKIRDATAVRRDRK